MACRSRSRGLTLIELLVVLAILITLATVAVTAGEGLVDQSRYEKTLTSLEAVEEAILGDPKLRDGQGRERVTGFVADIGRLPRLLDTSAGRALSELWLRDPLDPIYPLYGPQSAPGDGDVSVFCGWRGPYLRLPSDLSQLLDGWGRPFRVKDADDGSEVEDVETPIGGLFSLGSDDASGGSSYAADLERVWAQGSGSSPVALRHQGHVSVRVVGDFSDLDDADDPAYYAVVRVYGPEHGHPATLGQLTSGGASITKGAPAVTLGPFTISSGPRWVRAYLTKQNPQGVDGDAELDSSTASDLHRSDILQVVVPRGAVLPDLELRLRVRVP